MENKCGYKKQADTNEIRKMSANELQQLLIKRYSDKVSKMNRSLICSELESIATTSLPLYNENNSCYIDAVLVALLYPILTHGCTLTWYKYLLKRKIDSENAILIRNELLDVLQNIEHISKMEDADHKTCTNIRKIFKKYKNYNKNHDNEWIRAQQDPVDVIYMLEHIFEIPDVNEFDLSNNSKEKSSLIGIQIQPYTLKYNDNVLFRQVFPSFKDPDTKIKRTYVKGSMIYIQINRNFNNDEKIKKEFKPSRKSKLFVLQSIILHIGNQPTSGHYVSVMKVNSKTWVYYDDLSDKLEYFSDKDLFTYKNGIVLANCTGLLYIRPKNIL